MRATSKIRLQCWSFHDHHCQVTFQSAGPARVMRATTRRIQTGLRFALAAVGAKRVAAISPPTDRTGIPDCARHALRREAYCGFGEVILISGRGKKDQAAAANSLIDFGVFARRASGASGLRAARDAQLHQLNTLRLPLPWQAAENESARPNRAGAVQHGSRVSGI